MVSDGIQVRLHGVTRIYPAGEGQKPVHALGPLDLELRQGEFFSVVGPSGCGKSTLARRHRRACEPILGHGDLRRASRSPGVVPDGVGVVFQEDASFPWLTSTTTPPSRCAAPDCPRRRSASACEHTLSFMGLMPLCAGLSGAALRRHAAAGLHRPHPGHAAAPASARRALRRARPADPAADGRRAARSSGARPAPPSC